jgi:hypothetical protein
MENKTRRSTMTDDFSMVETLTLLSLFAVSGLVLTWFRRRANDPRRRNVQEEIARLQHREHWLRQRLEVAQRERWGHDMIVSLTAELSATAEELSGAMARATANHRA